MSGRRSRPAGKAPSRLWPKLFDDFDAIHLSRQLRGRVLLAVRAQFRCQGHLCGGRREIHGAQRCYAGLFLSGEAGHWYLGTSDNFYCTQTGAVPGCTPPFPNGIPYKSYTTWDVGFAITRSVFTLDFRYYDSNLNKGDCNAFTSDHTARFTGDFTPINPAGLGSNWCSATFVVTGKFDLTAMANLK